MKIYTVLIIMIISACSSNNAEERKDGFSQPVTNPEDSLFKAVMDEHDVAMPKMKKLASSRVRIDSLAKRKSKNDRQQLESISQDLKNAEDHMNTWMEQFSIDSMQDNTQKRLEYLSSEQVKARNVKEEVLSAITRADSVLNK